MEFSTSALNSVDLPTFGRPTIPVFSAIEVTVVARNARARGGPHRLADAERDGCARSVAAEPRATNLQVWSAMADMVEAGA